MPEAHAGDLLWLPSQERQRNARVTQFAQFAQSRYDRHFDNYDELWAWSTKDLAAFWSALTEWFGVRWHTAPEATLASSKMPGAQWFPGARVNYAEHILFPPAGVDPHSIAVLFEREDGLREEVTWAQLRAKVAAVRSWLTAQGVRRGDRVAALLPNCPQALIAMLACASLGVIWSSCSPDFGPSAVVDRFRQIEPTVLFVVDGYIYGGKAFNLASTVETLNRELPSLRALVRVPYLGDDTDNLGLAAVAWHDVISSPGTLEFADTAFAEPLVIVYSSGTTGLPKAIMHGHGGMLVEHAKLLALHLDLKPLHRFFWFTTTGWVMWNILISGLLCGSTIVLYDGNPSHPNPDRLWEIAARDRITTFGVSAAYLHSCQNTGLYPRGGLDLTCVATVGSTGSPLSPDAFRWVYQSVGDDIYLASISGGTDVCSALLGTAPTLPVRAGEVARAHLGCRAQVWDSHGRDVVDALGELVITAPMPSMPVAFWNDPDEAKMRAAYFNTYKGVWRHGDWVSHLSNGSWVIHGRSDATLNRGGVRMGTAEFYALVEQDPAVADSLIIDSSTDAHPGELLLFLVTAGDEELEHVAQRLKTTIRTQLSPRHVPDQILMVSDIPRTITNKKCEVLVKRLFAGAPVEEVSNTGALANPGAIPEFAVLAARRQIELHQD